MILEIERSSKDQEIKRFSLDLSSYSFMSLLLLESVLDTVFKGQICNCITLLLPWHAACCAGLLQSCLTLCYPLNGSPPGSSVHGISQARILEWVSISASGGSSRPRDGTGHLLRLLHWHVGSLPLASPGKPITMISSISEVSTVFELPCQICVLSHRNPHNMSAVPQPLLGSFLLLAPTALTSP